MNPTKNLTNPKLYMTLTKNLIEPKPYMNPTWYDYKTKKRTSYNKNVDIELTGHDAFLE